MKNTIVNILIVSSFCLTACRINKPDFIPYTVNNDGSNPNGYYVGICESYSLERGCYKNGEKMGWWFGYLNTHKLYFIAKYKHNVGRVYYGIVDTSSNKLRLNGEVFYSKFNKNLCYQTKYVQYFSNARVSKCLIERLDSSKRFKPYIETYYDSLGNELYYRKFNIETEMPILVRKFDTKLNKKVVLRKRKLEQIEKDFQKKIEMENKQ